MLPIVFDVSDESILEVVKSLRAHNEKNMLVIAPITGSVSITGVSEEAENGYHKVKCELWLPSNAIQGKEALDDIGLLTILSVPKVRVKAHLTNEVEMGVSE